MSSILPVYSRSSLSFTHGEGAYLYSVDGKRYLDFAAGIAVNALGHAHPSVVQALQEQAGKLWHVSNLYTIEGLDRLGDRFIERTAFDRVFFCNSGTEAIECCIKMLRKYHDDTGHPDKYRVVTFEGAFHGRTMAAISASNRMRVMDGFGPALDGFDNVPFGDLDAVKAAITEETAAILVEPVQGEGGIRPAPEGFLQALRELCDMHGLLLCFDEVQCGMGRTGDLFAYETYGIVPDILTSAKGIGNGFPLGACFATERAAQGMTPGTHGSTYGGNPLAMAVGNAVLDVVLGAGFLDRVSVMGGALRSALEELAVQHSDIIDLVRGEGLMLGIKLHESYVAKDMVEALREVGLLTVPAADNVVRILPPLIITQAHIDEAVVLIDSVFNTKRG